jgi:RES domain-containing protein
LIVWRICKKRHRATSFCGIGAEKYGGRWNRKGERMVYTSGSLSLAALELFVHLDPQTIPSDLIWVRAAIPDTISIETLTAKALPANWRRYPAPARLQAIGSKWLRELRSFVLVVPSAVNPEEQNMLLNPLHPDATSLSRVQSKPFHFDPRMWR